MRSALASWQTVGRVADEEAGEWLALQRSRGYRGPIERALAWRFRRSRLAIPPHDRAWVAFVLDEHGGVARRVAPPLFQRVLGVHDDALGFTLEWIEAVPLRRLLRDHGARRSSRRARRTDHFSL